jgi:urease accessory protein
VTLPFAHAVRPLVSTDSVADWVVLTYEERLVRRRRLVTLGETAFMVDLAELTALDEGLVLVLADGRLIGVRAAQEPLLEVQGDMPRLAWHIGNRHAPCQIGVDRLWVRADKVMARMLQGLGAQVVPVMAAFRPEGGAYGPGRTQGHQHAD